MTVRAADETGRQIDRAAEICLAKNVRLTDIRRTVLSLVLEASAPVGAYALLDRLKEEKSNATAVTVYRALDFLLENGLVHKIERLDAFVACTEQDEHEHHGHDVLFLICRSCGSVTELDDHGIAQAINGAASQQGFRPAHATIEVEGTCGACLTRPPVAQAS